MDKKVHQIYDLGHKLKRIGVLVKQHQHQAMRARIDDVIRRVEAAKARERQARLERKVVDDFGKRRQAAINTAVSMMESVERYVVTHIGHGGVRTLALGRYTYATEAEAQAWVDAEMKDNSEERLKKLYGLPLAVRACRCRVTNFDPKEIYFDYGAQS